MKWTIRQFTFCEDQQLLISEQGEFPLEPRQAEVLAFFCRKPNQLITRDELVAEVWQGSVVTDNAINRIIAKLRKSLNDSAKQSEFIVTLPRKGYRFIAPVVAQEPADTPYESQEKVASHDQKTPVLFNRMIIGLLGVSLAAFMLFKFWPGENQKYQTKFKSIKALTRDRGEEFLPAVSPDGRYLTYAAYKDDYLSLYIKDLKTNEKRLLSDLKGNAGNGDWSGDGSQFLYLYTTPETCELRIIEFDKVDKLSIKSKKTVHECSTRSYGSFAFAHNGHEIIYSEREHGKDAYQIYIKNLDTGKIIRPEQPPLFLAGNVYFDLHPKENKLLVASPDETQQLSFYTVDLDKNELNFSFRMEGYICCPVWGHTGESIVMASSLPSFSLWEMDLDGKNLRTIYSGLHRIYKLKRVADETGFVYSGGMDNFDIDYQSFDGAIQKKFIQSMVADYAPSISNDQQYLAYVSSQSGKGQVWLHKLSSGEERKLTDFSKSDHYFSLQWSPDDQKIAALTINSIRVVNTLSGENHAVELPLQGIRGLSWGTENTLSFSLKNEGRWSVYQYDLLTHKLHQQDPKWAYEYHYFSLQKNKADTRDFWKNKVLKIDHQGNFYVDQQRLDISIKNPVDYRRRFLFQVVDDIIYYFEQVSSTNTERSADKDSSANKNKYSEEESIYLTSYSITTGEKKRLALLEREMPFAIWGNGFFLVKDSELNADIFRLNFEK
ncbi:winged helix-turn-helix domain-containing protein [Aliikangiella sp. G2MR2-5]|uniref:winged helix-turn-helix domain-containing protein n=1 Tax=Aliikangiella sp. G2MR2-5 TaxID=2788943 RepID=UPI0018AC83D2|nr:winged helix-turn-helix domain-containing protein [Aliikangiella sp. G2MR2-5]